MSADHTCDSAAAAPQRGGACQVPPAVVPCGAASGCGVASAPEQTPRAAQHDDDADDADAMPGGCCCHRNGAVTFAAYFMICGVVLIATAKLWWSWASVAEVALAVSPDPTSVQYYRSQPKLYGAYQDLRRRAMLLSADARLRILASHDLTTVKVVAISFIVVGTVKTTLSVALMVAVLTEWRGALRPWLVGNCFALGAAALLVAGSEGFLLHAPAGAVFAMPGSSSPRGVALALSVCSCVYLVLDVCSMICVRRFETDLLSQPPKQITPAVAKLV